MSASEQEGQGPVIKDRRRIDPVTGQPRHPAESPEDSGQAEASDGPAGQTPRGAGQPRPGRHAASEPGSPRQEAAGAGQPTTDSASRGDEESDHAEAPAPVDAADTSNKK